MRQALAFFDQLFEFDHELADVFERAVHRSEAHIGHRIGVVELAHERFADHRTDDFFFAALLQRPLDAVGDRFDGVDADRPFFTGALETVDDLDPVIAFAPAVFLDHQRHHLLDPLVGREAPGAALALAPAPHHVAVLAQSRIDDSILGLVAKGTFHSVNEDQIEDRRQSHSLSRAPSH